MTVKELINSLESLIKFNCISENDQIFIDFENKKYIGCINYIYIDVDLKDTIRKIYLNVEEEK